MTSKQADNLVLRPNTLVAAIWLQAKILVKKNHFSNASVTNVLHSQTVPPAKMSVVRRFGRRGDCAQQDELATILR